MSSSTGAFIFIYFLLLLLSRPSSTLLLFLSPSPLAGCASDKSENKQIEARVDLPAATSSDRSTSSSRVKMLHDDEKSNATPPPPSKKKRRRGSRSKPPTQRSCELPRLSHTRLRSFRLIHCFLCLGRATTKVQSEVLARHASRRRGAVKERAVQEIRSRIELPACSDKKGWKASTQCWLVVHLDRTTTRDGCRNPRPDKYCCHWDRRHYSRKKTRRQEQERTGCTPPLSL